MILMGHGRVEFVQAGWTVFGIFWNGLYLESVRLAHVEGKMGALRKTFRRVNVDKTFRRANSGFVDQLTSLELYPISISYIFHIHLNAKTPEAMQGVSPEARSPDARKRTGQREWKRKDTTHGRMEASKTTKNNAPTKFT